MADNTKPIIIESILGGESPYFNFGSPDEYQQSIGIDPDVAFSRYTPSGYMVPSFFSESASMGNNYPLWVITNPKDANYYIYTLFGSAYSFTAAGGNPTALSDGGSLSNASGNGSAYYDNYVYFAKNTTIARYGPLDGSPTFNGDYWVGSLSKTRLTNTTYPAVNSFGGVTNLNHVMHRHGNGKLYFADIVGNQGVLHCISTKKTTVEGDTDNGSAFNVIDFPYGYWPTALESFGTDMVVALYETNTSINSKQRAKIALWDPTNTDTYKLITNDEFPDPFVAALINANGVLYTVSGIPGAIGARVCRYLGGYTFEQVAYLDYMSLPIPGGITASLNKVSFGSQSYRSGSAQGSIISIGSKLSPVSNKVFNTIGPVGSVIFGVAPYAASGLQGATLVFGAYDGNSVMVVPSLPGSISGATTGAYWVSQTYRLPQRFKIKKISIPLHKLMADTFAIVPKIRVDDNTTTTTLQTINSTNYPNDLRIVLQPTGVTGNFNFNLELDFSGSANVSSFEVGIAFPIVIEYELIDD